MNNKNIEKEFEEMKNAYKDMFDNITIEQFKQVKEKVENERKLTATKMFENLNFESEKTDEYLIYRKGWKEIEFNLLDKVMYLSETSFNAKEMRAINKQIEELGWYSEQ